MKSLLILPVLGACVYFFLHPAPESPATAAASVVKSSGTPSARPASTPSNFLKRPGDRAREVAGQVRQRAGESF